MPVLIRATTARNMFDSLDDDFLSREVVLARSTVVTNHVRRDTPANIILPRAEFRSSGKRSGSASRRRRSKYGAHDITQSEGCSRREECPRLAGRSYVNIITCHTLRSIYSRSKRRSLPTTLAPNSSRSRNRSIPSIQRSTIHLSSRNIIRRALGTLGASVLIV